MRAAYLYGDRDVRIEEAPDPHLQGPRDAVIEVVLSCICGSDLHHYHREGQRSRPFAIGHEFLGRVVAVGEEVTRVQVGDLAVAPFLWSCGRCTFCRTGLPSSCVRGGGWGAPDIGGGQGEIVRVPEADGTLVPLPVDSGSELLPDLLTLSDVLGTGYHAATTAGVGAGTTVTVIGDGAVGLLAVLSARLLGAERIILMGRHEARTDLGREFGADDVVAERGEEGIEKVRSLTAGLGSDAVLECVGHLASLDQAFGAVRDGGRISRVGVPQYREADIGAARQFIRNVTLTGGVAPVRAYIDRLMPLILDGSISPGKVFDREVDLDGVPEGYRAMDEREALKVLVRP